MSVSSLNQYLSGEPLSSRVADRKDGVKLERIAKRAESTPAQVRDLDETNKQSVRSKAADYRRASRNAAQSADTIDVAREEMAKVRNGLARLREIAIKLNNSGDSAVLRQEFQALSQKVRDLTAQASLGMAGIYESSDVELPQLTLPEDLSEADLEAVNQAYEEISSHIQQLDEQYRDVDTVSALFEISAQNQEAARASLPDAASENLIDQLLAAVPQSVSAQSDRLSSQTLDLLQG